jgi:hypothetical protein
MKPMLQFAAGAVLCFVLVGYWVRATAQQPIAPEASNPTICAQLNVNGRASAPLQPVTLPPLRQPWVPGSRSQLHSWCHQSHPDN